MSIRTELDKLLAHAVANRTRNSSTTVPRDFALTILVGNRTFHVDGGEPLWVKKDSETEFYVTLESQSSQLTFAKSPTGDYRVTRRFIPTNGTKHTARVEIILNRRDTFDYS